MTHEEVYYPYRNTLLTPTRVRELSKIQAYRPIVDVILCWCCIIGTWFLVACISHWLVIVFAIPLIGNRYYALFIIGHDGFHKRLFSDVRRNDLFADIFIYAPIGAITRLNKKNHLTHHTHLANEEDPDRHKYGCFNKTTPLQFIGYLTGLTSVWRSAKNVFFENKTALSVDTNRSSPNLPSQYNQRDIIILVTWQILLIGGLTITIGWWAYPVLWLLPIYCFSFLPDNLRTFAEHSQPYADSTADEHRLITYLAPPFEKILFAPMNMNYHTVHHLWPSIPYYNLPTADREIRATTIPPDAVLGLEWRDSYFKYLLRYFHVLPLEECRKDPSLPAEFSRSAPPLIAETKVPQCSVCGNNLSKQYTSGFDYEIKTCRNLWRFVQCCKCTHVWLHPRPAINTLPLIYPRTYYAYNYEKAISRLAIWGKHKLDQKKFNFIFKYQTHQPKSYLDIGCGNGRFLELLDKHGLSREQIFGLELEEGVVTNLRKNGYQVFNERIEEATSIPESSMDLITMFHVIEHLEDPILALQKIAAWLSPNGLFALETPNLHSLDARIFKNQYWGGYHFPRHWHLFSPTTIEQALEKAGLELVSLHFQTGHSFWMFSFHHYLRYGSIPLMKNLAHWFNPFRSILPLTAFTAFDKFRSFFGAKTSSMLVIARRKAIA